MLRRTLLLLSAALLATLCMAATPMAAGMDGVIMRGGKMMMMKAGKAMDPMTASITMSNGAVVTPDGTVKLPGGQQMYMKDGQMMMMDGTIMDGGNPLPMMKPKGMDAGE
jgi:Domain of unknown function (DUF6799)